MSLEAARKHGVQLTAHTAYGLLQKCKRTRDLGAGRTLQSLISRSELGSNTLFRNQLIRVFALCGSLPDALQAFKTIRCPDTHSWTAILNAHLSHGEGSRAIELYHEMRRSRIQPNDYVYVTVLKACASLKALAEGREIHGHIVDSGYESSVYVANALIDMYARCRSLKDSRRVFDRLVGRDVVSWNALIAGFVHHGLAQQALELFHTMLLEHVNPDKVTYLALLKACESFATLDQGKLIHSQICKRGLDSDGSLKNALISMYAKGGSLDEAREVFDQTMDKDLVTWTAMISGYAQHGFGQEALNLFKEMQSQGIRPDAITYCSILKASGAVAAIGFGMQIHEQVLSDHLESDVFVGSSLVDMYAKCGRLDLACQVFQRLPTKNTVSWNTMIGAYTKNGNAKAAFLSYEEMQLSQIRPDKLTFVSILKACGSIGAIERGKSFHKELIQNGIDIDTLVGSTLIEMYSECGCLEDADKVFMSLFLRDSTSWNAIVICYAQHGLILEALYFLGLMQLDGIKPDTASFVSILQACGNTGSLDEGIKFHSEICEAGLEFDASIGNSLVGMYAKCGKMQQSLSIFDSLLLKTTASYNAIITGYVEHGDFKLALQIFIDMKEKGVKPDHVTYLTLLKGCGTLAALEEGRMIHKEIKESGLAGNIRVCNVLIDMYAKCGSLDEALRVFHDLPEKDVVSWNTIISGYAQHGLSEKALQLYKCLEDEGISPNYVTFVNVLKVCGGIPSLVEGRLVHSHTVKAGMDADAHVGSAIVSMYAKCGSLEEAHNAFNKIAKKDTVSYSTLISAYARNGLDHQSLEFFEDMQLEGIRPDAATFVSALKACGNVADMHQGKLIHSQIVERGFESNAHVASALVDMYGRCGNTILARDIFNRLPEKDITSWNTMISAYAQNGYGHDALDLFQQMKKYGTNPNGITFVSLLSACSHSSLVDEGLALYNSMTEDYGLVPLKEHCTSLLDLLSRSVTRSSEENMPIP